MQIGKTDAEMQRQIIRESDFLQAACFDRLLLSVGKLTGAHTLQKRELLLTIPKAGGFSDTGFAGLLRPWHIRG